MEGNFQIELNRIREEANWGFEKIQEDFHQKLEAIRTSSVAERINRIQDNTIREISEIPKKVEYQATGIGVGSVDFVCAAVSSIVLAYSPLLPDMKLWAVPLLLGADGITRYVGVATENKNLASYGLVEVVWGIRKLSSYLRRQ